MLLELAEARREAQTEPDPWLAGVLKLLDAADPPSLSALSRQLNYSSSALRARFRAATGISMQEHVLQGRIARARALLADTDLPLKAIARQLGYANEFYFSRQFHQRTGVAPGAFRKSRGLE